MDVMKIGAFIKSQRAELNMTQKDLAEKIGCTDKAISRWETGKGLPDMSFIIPLSKVLNVSVSELIYGEKFTPEGSTNNAMIEENYTDEMNEIISEESSVKEIIKKTDETLINVMNESQKEIKKTTRFSYIILTLFCLQMLVFFVFPNFVPNTFEPAEMMIAFSVLISIIIGFVNNKFKWLFPLGIGIVFFVINIINHSDEGFLAAVFGLYFSIGSLILIAICSLIKCVIKKLKK